MNEMWGPIAALAAGWCAWRTLRWLRRPSTLKIVTVIDGDTCMGVDGKGRAYKLRIRRVDCPERGQHLAQEAKECLSQLLLGKHPSVRWHGKDRYRRFLVDLSLAGRDAATELVRAGLARPLGGGLAIRMAARWAQLKGIGVWNSSHKPHESWRRRHKALSWIVWKWETGARKRAKRPNR